MKENKIAMYRRLADAADLITQKIAPQIEVLQGLNDKAVAAKNASDEGNTIKDGEGGIWKTVFAVAQTIENETVGMETERHQLFTDALSLFLIPKTDDAGKPLKLSTVGQYASTARKLLCEVVTKQGTKLDKYADLGVKDVRQLFRNKADAVMLEALSEAGKQARYAIKHGGEDAHKELSELFALITEVYRPIKAKKDAASKKGQAAVAVPELQQQAPAEAGNVETVAAELAGVEEVEGDEKQAVGA